MKYTILFLLLVTHTLFAQEFKPSDWGQISPEEINMKACLFDSSATAVVLFDLGKSKFFKSKSGFDIEHKRHKRIKIFDSKDIENATISIPFYRGRNKKEKIKSIQAFTYNLENGVLVKQKLDIASIYTEKINMWWSQKKFVFPNVKDGSILELRYTHITPFIFNLCDWEFQCQIPTLYSEYQVSMIPFFEYARLSQGFDSLDVDKSVKSREVHYYAGIDYGELVHTFGLKNVEAFDDESYITTKNDYIKKIDFQLSKIHRTNGMTDNIIKSWYELNKNLLSSEYFGKYTRSCKRFAKKILNEKLDLTNKSKKEKIEAIIQYVKDNFYWNEYYGKSALQSAKNFYNKKTGNAAEINLFLLALLREAGIKAEPVVISTRNHGKIKFKYPYKRALNYVIILINDENKFLVDATDPLLKYDIIPTYCINEYGLVVNKQKKVQWLSIKYNKPSSNRKDIVIDINPETNNAKVSFVVTTKSFEANELRKEYRNKTDLIRKEFEKYISEIDSIKTINYKSSSQPYIISMKGNTEINYAGNYLFFKPFLNFPISENLFTEKERNYPVDMIYPKKHKFYSRINIPNGYLPKNLPEPYSFSDDLTAISFNSFFNKEENQIQFIARYSFKKAIYKPEEYLQLKKNIDLIIEKFNQEVYIAIE